MKTTICPFCRNKEVRKLEEILSPFNQKTYELIECCNCYLQFFVPLVFENVYEAEIIQEYVEFHKGRKNYPVWTQTMIQVIKDKDINLNHKKILEIGAGDGINYVALNEICQIRPENYLIIELDSKSIEQCKLKGITKIINSVFDKSTISNINDTFDIILILEVLEHQTNPGEFLELVFSLLNQGGLVILTVPNRERFFINEFNGDLPPHHFLRFNKKFFKRNFANHLAFLKDYSGNQKYNKINNIKPAALKLTSTLKLNSNLWILFAPLIPIIRVIIDFMANIKGRGIIAIIRKKC